MPDFCFPFKTRPDLDWKGGRAFGASRDKGKRLHAGCDLIKPVGEVIHAVADGILVHQETSFYWKTNYVTYQHGSILVRYGEIMPRSHSGAKTVKKGDPIAKVGQLINPKTGKKAGHMLHIEIFTNGSLHTTLSSTVGKYKRRKDVTDPAPYLDVWVNNLAPG